MPAISAPVKLSPVGDFIVGSALGAVAVLRGLPLLAFVIMTGFVVAVAELGTVVVTPLAFGCVVTVVVGRVVVVVGRVVVVVATPPVFPVLPVLPVTSEEATLLSSQLMGAPTFEAAAPLE
jgi:hypothetical protein